MVTGSNNCKNTEHTEIFTKGITVITVRTENSDNMQEF